MDIEELKKEIFNLSMYRIELGEEETKDVLLRLGYSFSTMNVFKETLAVQEHHAKISDSVSYFLKQRGGYVADTLVVLIDSAANNNPALLAGLFGYVANGEGQYVSARPLSNVELMI